MILQDVPVEGANKRLKANPHSAGHASVPQAESIEFPTHTKVLYEPAEALDITVSFTDGKLRLEMVSHLPRVTAVHFLATNQNRSAPVWFLLLDCLHV